eukprot:c43004_g1_i1 orf=320-712(+)
MKEQFCWRLNRSCSFIGMLPISSLKLLTTWRKRKRVKTYEDSLWTQTSLHYLEAETSLHIFQPSPVVAYVFTLKEMLEATDKFCSDNLLGEGGFGRVYRGVLKSGMVVAIKQMDTSTSRATQGEREFRAE